MVNNQRLMVLTLRLTKYHKITLRKPDGFDIEADKYTASGWPSVSRDVLKSLAGKVSVDFDFVDEYIDEELTETVTKNLYEDNETPPSEDRDTSAYGTAYVAFGSGQAGIEACHAIAALCEFCSIDSLISNFILPLQAYLGTTKARILFAMLYSSLVL